MKGGGRRVKFGFLEIDIEPPYLHFIEITHGH